MLVDVFIKQNFLILQFTDGMEIADHYIDLK